MEVETRPPGYMTSQEVVLRRALPDYDGLSDEERAERELLRSPSNERCSQNKNSSTYSPDVDEDELLRDDPVIDKCSVLDVICNGTDSTPGDDEVFRTKSDECDNSQKGDVGDLGSEKNETAISEDQSVSTETCISPIAQALSKDDVTVNDAVISNLIVEHPEETERCPSESSEQPQEGSCPDNNDVTTREDVPESVQDGSNNSAEPSHVDGIPNIELGDDGSSDCPVVIAATTLPVPLEELEGIEQNVESPLEDEIAEVPDGCDAPAGDAPEEGIGTIDIGNDEGANEPKSLPDASDECEPAPVDNNVVEDEPMALANGDETKNDDDINDESEPVPAGIDVVEGDGEGSKNDDVIDDGGGEGDEPKETTDDENEDKEPAEVEESMGPDLEDDNTMDHMIPRDPMDVDQEEDVDGNGTPEYRGMTDEILPIIESELDDQPPEGEGVFDTEVEDDGAVAAVDEIEETQDGSVSMDIAENDVSRGAEEFDDGITIEDQTTEEDARKKPLDKFSSEGSQKLKRRVSIESSTLSDTPPQKKLKRQSSLDNLDECASAFDKEKFMKDIKSGKEEPSVPTEKATKSADLEAEPLPSKGPQEDVAKVCISPSKSPGTLCIDLDTDDDKPPGESFELKDGVDENKLEDEEEQSPRSKRISSGPALDALFNGKKEITLSRKMFTRILKSYVSQYVLTLGTVGKATRISLKGEDAINKMNAGITSYEKQRDDYKAIVRKLIEDREASKKWDETLIPPKMTRSVGLQVCTVGSINVKEAVNQPTQPVKSVQPRNVLPNPNVAMLAQKQAYAMQQKIQAEQQKKKALQQLENLPSRTTGVAKKSTGGRPVNNAIQAPGGFKTKSMLNGISNPASINKSSPSMLNRTSSPQPVSKPPNATISPNSKTITIGGKNVIVKSPIKPPQIKTTLNPVLQRALRQATQPQRIPAAAAASPRLSPNSSGQLQANRNLASGPGRPSPTKPQTPQNILASPSTPQQKKSGPAEATIDLTDDDAPQSSKALGSAMKRSAQSGPGNSTKILPAPNNLKQRGHPPLPPNPPCIPPRQSPPKPFLGICNTQQGTQGIMLTWHFNNVLPVRKILKFQVFAYQESKGTPDELWKKVGDVDALPLPMACTLTQFREGYTYHFIVRAVDDVGTIGPFSAPNTITLMKKTS